MKKRSHMELISFPTRVKPTTDRPLSEFYLRTLLHWFHFIQVTISLRIYFHFFQKSINYSQGKYKRNQCLMSVFKFDRHGYILQPIFSRAIIINPRIILQMSRSTTNVFEAVKKSRNRCFIGFITLLYALSFKSDKILLLVFQTLHHFIKPQKSHFLRNSTWERFFIFVYSTAFSTL